MTLPDRPDLLELGPEALAAQSNLGLVKRAQRDLAEGRRPELRVDPMQPTILLGTCDDGAEVRVPPPPAPATCSCGAPKCRHRIATVLAYREAIGAAPVVLEAPRASADAIAAAFGPARLAAAGAARAEQPTVEVHLASGEAPIPAVRLPGCTVRFLGRDPVASARCDCAASSKREGDGPERCEHVILALWAFDQHAATPGPTTFRLRDPAASELAIELPAQAPFDELARQLVSRGVVGLGESFTHAAATARTEAERAGARWLSLAVTELVQQVDAYARRSARYDASRVTAILGELGARLRAAAGSELPPRFVLGIGLPGETRLERTRLISLGARLSADGEDARADVTLIEPETGTPLVFEKRWSAAELAVSPDLARRPALPRIMLSALAEGQLVTDGAVRAADGTVSFRSGRGTASTAVLPQVGDWAALSPRLVVRDFEAARKIRQAGTPEFLGSRTRAERLVVVTGFVVEELAFAAADQAISATLVDAAGVRLHVVRRHQAIAPHALHLLAASLPRAVHVAGDLRLVHGALVLDPLSVVADGKVHVLDTSTRPAASSLDVLPQTGADALSRLTDRGAPLVVLRAFLDELVHTGLARRREEQLAGAGATIDVLEAHGYLRLGAVLRRWHAAPNDATAILDAMVLAVVAEHA